MPIRLILLDDHPLYRQGVLSVLMGDPDIEVVGEGGSGEELMQLIADHQPEVILLDLNMPQRAGGSIHTPGNRFQALEAIKHVVRTQPAIHILIISQYVDRAIIEGAAEAGVSGYIVKDDLQTRSLPDAIRAVHQGGVVFSKVVQAKLKAVQTKVRDKPTGLTPRQIETLQAIVTNPELSSTLHAHNLNISENTLRNHLAAIFERLGVNNLTAAVVRAIQGGWVRFP